MPRFSLLPAEIDWTEQGEPLSRAFGDVYFSRGCGLAETRHVFIEHNRLEPRWRAWEPGRRHFTVGETGFGTGLNFLATWALWRELQPPGSLHFVSCEKFPLRREDMVHSHALWPELGELTSALAEQYPPLVEGVHRLNFDQGRVRLTLLLGDAQDGLRWLLDGLDEPGFAVDAWFLDGFAPAKNADLWTEQLCQRIAALSAVGTSFSTFTSAGAVKRGLQQAGFQVAKVPGFGRKREMLAGTMLAPPPRHRMRTPWFAAPSAAPTRRAMVIGAGLAGTSTALALHERGWQVSLVERSAPGSGASGNLQGLLYAKLSAHRTPQSEFVLASYLHACRHYRQLGLERGEGELGGLLQLAYDEAEREHQRKIAEAFAGHGEIVQPATAALASAMAGIELEHPGLLFPGAGWLCPGAICKRLASAPGLELLIGRQVEQLRRESGVWQALDAEGALIAAAEVCIIANGTDANCFSQTQWLPLKPIRGQVSHLAATEQSGALRLPISHDGYVSPAAGDLHCAGATFHPLDPTPEARAEDDAHNLDILRQHLPALHGALGAPPRVVGQRVGWRTTVPDYQPVVGPVPDAAAFERDYAGLRNDARAVIDMPGACLPGLYLNTAHGARGLATTPLCAELLAAIICGEPRPLDGEIVPFLHPGRFLIRAQSRRQKH